MIERSALEADALIGKRPEHGRQGDAFDRLWTPRDQTGRRVVAGERVEVDDLLQRGLAAGVEVGPGELDVPKIRRLEHPAHPQREARAISRGDGEKVARRIASAKADIVARRLDAGVE